MSSDGSRDEGNSAFGDSSPFGGESEVSPFGGTEGDVETGSSSQLTASPADYVPSQSVDELSEPAALPNNLVDPFADFENFNRNELMKHVYDTATRYFLAVAFTDGKVPDRDKARDLFMKVFDHSIMSVAICFNDKNLEQAFAEMEARLNHEENPYKLAVAREFRNITLMAQSE